MDLERMFDGGFFERFERKKIRPGYICDSCAKDNNAKTVAGHVCTSHLGKCQVCHREKSLMHTSDYNWPNQVELERGREF